MCRFENAETRGDCRYRGGGGVEDVENCRGSRGCSRRDRDTVFSFERFLSQDVLSCGRKTLWPDVGEE